MSEPANVLTAENNRGISERTDLAVTHVSARRGAEAGANDLARSTFGADLPSRSRAVEVGDLLIVWAGPQQWLFVEPKQSGSDASARLAKTFNGLASVVDVSDSRSIFRLAEAQPSESLMRRMAIDFSDAAFQPGDVAITQVSHLGVMVWRLPDGSGYEFACARTYSRDFFRWLCQD